MNAKDIVRSLQAKLGWINRLPSWLNEGLGGAALTLLLWWPFQLWAVPVALVLNEAYEHWLDPWGYNPNDVVERVRGVGVGVVLVLVIHHFLSGS